MKGKKVIRLIFSTIITLIIISFIFFPKQVSDRIIEPLVLKFSETFTNNMVDAFNESLDLDMSHIELDNNGNEKTASSEESKK